MPQPSSPQPESSSRGRGAFHSLRGGLLLPIAIVAALGACGANSTNAGPAGRARRPALPHDVVEKAALPLYVLHGEERLTEPELWERMAGSEVICFGEQHDLPEHHYAQQRALSELATRSAATQRTLGVGFEMFQRPYQAALTSFVAGATLEADFLIESDYEERWGFDFSLYRPLLQTVREFSLEALALNAPRELTRKIGRSGIAKLDASERKQLPELDLENAEHRAYFDAAMADHPMPAGGPDMDDMYAVQVVWDEVMAETAAAWLSRAGEGAQLIVFAGAGHCHRGAIPARITRRTGSPVLSVAPVLASDLSDYHGRHLYDWLVVLDD